MKYLLTILLLCSCTASKKTATVVLDGTASRITGGDGHGYFKSFEWKQISGPAAPIDSPRAEVTQTKIGPGSYAWELTGIDNLNQVGKDTLKINY